MKHQSARQRSQGAGNCEEDVSGAVVMSNENPRCDQRGSQGAGTPGKIEERKQRCTALRKVSADKKGDRGHGDSDADPKQKESRRQKSARRGSDCQAHARHSGKSGCHFAGVISFAKQRTNGGAREIEKKQQTGI